MLTATRSQRPRAASNTGEQALLVLRKSGAMTSPDDARSEAVCRATALADDTYSFAQPSVVGALLEVIALDSDEARMVYEKQHKYGSQARSESHTGFVAAGSDNPGVVC